MKKYVVEIEVYDNTELEYLENTIDEALCDANVDCTFELKEINTER